MIKMFFYREWRSVPGCVCCIKWRSVSELLYIETRNSAHRMSTPGLKQGHDTGLKTDESDNLIHQNAIAGGQPDCIQMLAIARATEACRSFSSLYCR